MSESQKKPTIKELRAEARRLGITSEQAGCSIDELVRQAQQQDSPFDWLAIQVPPPDDAEPTAPSPAEAACEVSDEEEPKYDPPPENDNSTDEEEENEPPADSPLPEDREINITVPLADSDFADCHISRRLDIHNLTPTQRLTLKRLTFALDRRGAGLRNGRRVISGADAVRWLFENIGVD